MPAEESPELLPATSPTGAVCRRWLLSGGDRFDVGGLVAGGIMIGAGATPGGGPKEAGGDFVFANALSMVATTGGADFGGGGSRNPAALSAAGGGLEGGGGGLGEATRGGGGAFGSSGRMHGCGGTCNSAPSGGSSLSFSNCKSSSGLISRHHAWSRSPLTESTMIERSMSGPSYHWRN